MGGTNAAAVDWIAAHLLAYDVERIPLVREAFGSFRWPLTGFMPSDISVVGDASIPGGDMRALASRALAAGVEHPIGWRDARLPEAAAVQVADWRHALVEVPPSDRQLPPGRHRATGRAAGAPAA